MTNQQTALLLRPSEAQWDALPRMLSPAVLRGVLVVGFGAWLAADFVKSLGDDSLPATRTWAASLEPSTFMPDAAFTMLFLILLPVMIWPRAGIWVALLAVQLANITAIGMGLETLWWYWFSTVVLGGAALIDLSMGMRQFMELRKLRTALERKAPKTFPITDEQAKWSREDALGGRWSSPILAGVALAAYLLFSWLLNDSRANGPEPDPAPFDPFWLAVAFGAALGAVVLPCLLGWRIFRAKSTGSVLWVLPTPHDGPLSVEGMYWLHAGELSEDEQKRDGCSCAEQSKFEEAGFGTDYQDGVTVDRHCHVHGVDVVNSMGAPEFAAMARIERWVWNPLSDLPITAMGMPIGVLGYAGPGLPGHAGLVEDEGFSAMEGWRNKPTENHLRMSKTQRKPESEPATDPTPIPRTGRIDELDLRQFGIDGFARRYKHGHPIFVAADQGSGV